MNDDIKPDSVDPGISAGMGLEEPDSTSTEWVRRFVGIEPLMFVVRSVA